MLAPLVYWIVSLSTCGHEKKSQSRTVGLSDIMGQTMSTALGNTAPNVNSDNYNNNYNSNNNAINSSATQVFLEPYPTNKKRNRRGDLRANELQRLTADVLNLLPLWFPEMHQRTYFLPPVLMNKVQHKDAVVGGTAVQTVEKTPESDWRDDEVMQRTLLCLRALTHRRPEPMVVLLQMQHDNYLNKPCYAKAAARFPRPCDLDTKLRRGDFDLLFLHRQHGIIVAEIKSVGWRPGISCHIQDDSIVRKKVKQALDQLNKAKTVLSHLVQDLRPLPLLTKTLILPNVQSHRLRVLLQQDEELAKEFRACFDTPDIDSALDFCLCADHMTSYDKPADVTSNVFKALEEWWQHIVSRGGYTSHVCTGLKTGEEEDEVYKLLVARFCGPASTVQVHCVKPPRLEFRTLGHAVHEVGERMVEFVLFPEQLALLEEDEALVYLTGPPGTGKTLLLVLVALQWCRQGHDVHIVSTGSFSEAATQQLYYQVMKTLALDPDQDMASRIHLHLNGNNLKNLAAITTDLISAAGASERTQPEDGSAIQGEQLFVVADEIGQEFGEFFEEMKNNVADLHLWAASYRREYKPMEMTERAVRACLRCTPTVKRRMETAVSFADHNCVYSFEDKRAEYLAATEGPAEIFLSHEHHAPGPAMECLQCGHDIAHCLRQELHIGQRHPTSKAKGVKTPPPLQYSDVMIIPDFYQTYNDFLHDDVVDDVTGQINPATGIVRGLRSCDVPTYVVTRSDAESIRDLSQAWRDAVAVVEWGVGNGLERKVVVSVGGGRQGVSGVSGVLHGASRCVSQLIYITCPTE